MRIRPDRVAPNGLSRPSPKDVPLLYDLLGWKTHKLDGACRCSTNHNGVSKLWDGVDGDGNPHHHPESYTALFFDGHATRLSTDPFVIPRTQQVTVVKNELLNGMFRWHSFIVTVHVYFSSALQFYQTLYPYSTSVTFSSLLFTCFSYKLFVESN